MVKRRQCTYKDWLSEKTGCTEDQAQALDYLYHYGFDGKKAKCKHFSDKDGKRIFAKWRDLGIINRKGKIEVESKGDIYLEFLVFANVWSGMLELVK